MYLRRGPSTRTQQLVYARMRGGFKVHIAVPGADRSLCGDLVAEEYDEAKTARNVDLCLRCVTVRRLAHAAGAVPGETQR